MENVIPEEYQKYFNKKQAESESGVMALGKVMALIILLLILVNSLSAQSSHDLLMEGDNLFNKEQYNLAEDKYRKASETDKSGKANYNLGNTLYNQERYEEALNQYQSALTSNDPNVVSKAYYNLGNTHFQNQKYQESIQSFKNALKYNGEDQDTKENLMLAKQMLKQQQQQEQQQQQNQDQNQDENKDQEQQEQQQQEQEQQEDQEQEEEQESQSESQESEDQKEQEAEQADKKDLDKEDARKLLEIIDNEEKKVQEKLRKMKGNSKKPKKDW
ncbi:MAG: Ca-activated chloride channel family protein [Saprospiraceae bacterium]|jgi:Ca-activated chloride channel family protein